MDEVRGRGEVLVDGVLLLGWRGLSKGVDDVGDLFQRVFHLGEIRIVSRRGVEQIKLRWQFDGSV